MTTRQAEAATIARRAHQVVRVQPPTLGPKSCVVDGEEFEVVFDGEVAS